jgi:hypothetical protein
MVMRLLPIMLVLTSACGTFEEPSIVIDLRVLAMRIDIVDPSLATDTTRSEQVVDVDLMGAPSVGQIISQLRDAEVTAWVADPGRDRRLRWSMTLCLPNEEARCDRTLPYVELGVGEIFDPDLDPTPQRPNAIITMGDTRTANTISAMLLQAIEKDPVSAIGGVDLTIEMTLGGVDEPRENDIYASKKLRISPRIPSDRTPNANPRILNIESAKVAGLGDAPNITERRCCMGCPNTATVRQGDSITLFPNEFTDTREDYVAPGLDGNPVYLKETISYQWLATYGGWSDETTGGGHDILGNQSLLGSDWTAPPLGARSEPLLVSLWMIQRDERFGVTPFETCIVVDP